MEGWLAQLSDVNNLNTYLYKVLENNLYEFSHYIHRQLSAATSCHQ